ncbi:hypothetical protein F5Y19DRAFT_20521 [Xylariaceae sp. FL1651]|nr:hypothetical protein F5Y19DRAFT_20521 [Xylariaceae sp. FL1651]
MAVPGTTQALIAAFSFGILFNAASAALVLYIKGHGSAIYRDGLRLVLILFLLSSSSWALVEFLATLIDSNAASTCQVAVIFSSLFDQFGRVSVEQYLAWALQKGGAKTAFSVLPQILVFARLFVGIAFVAVTRTQFNPTCVPVSSVRAVSVAAIALDAVIVGLLSIHAFSNGQVKKDPSFQSTSLRTKTARLVLIGLAVWMGTSVTLLLGLNDIDLFYRTALPGIGLTILVGLVTVFFQTLAIPRDPPQRPDSPVLQRMERSRDLSSSDTADYPPARYEDLKEASTMSITAFAAKKETSRNIRRNDDGTFPAISRPFTADSDASKLPAQAQFSSQIKPSDFAPDFAAIQPLSETWKNSGGKSSSERTRAVPSKSKAKAGKLAISNPILNEDESTQNPLNRIPTIDLAEAANNDRLRREKYAQRISTLIAQRPAPRPPSPPTASNTATKERRATRELERSGSTKTAPSSSGLSVEGNASSTGTQLSPGAEAIRRRSPRQPEPAALATPFKAIKPGEPIRIPIPRPPEPVQALPPTIPEPVKTPLQRRPTTGLPSNPRAQTLKSLTAEAKNQKLQTVMFVNNIVYDNPDTVGDIVQELNKPRPLPPDSSDSVVNRPRPIPRNGDNDRQVFPAEVSPKNHRRSKSGGSIVSRKSILQSVPSNPTGLPSLPPMPQSVNPVTRALPNNTKSMTLDEKMNLLYSASLSAPSNTEFFAQRSLVPELPPIPTVLPGERPQLPLDVGVSTSESNSSARESRASKRTTTRTSSILGITEAPELMAQGSNLEMSLDTRYTAQDIGNSWLPGIPLNARDEGRLGSGEMKRRSSPVLPVGRQLSMSTVRSERRTGDEDAMTHWGSVHSPVAPVSRQNARSTYIRKDSHNAAAYEEVIMMLDTSFENMGTNHQLSYSEDDESPSNNSNTTQGISGQFHHRIGDACPTFSTRKDKLRSRKMPPPTPLLLNGKPTKRAIVVQTAEPSPIESPEAAYQVIQAQLRNFEQPNRESVESQGQRLALLANLEQEMGQLETKWQSTHERLGRDSMSSIRTSPSRNSRPTSIVAPSRPISQRSSVTSIIAERRASRRARMQNGGDEGTATPSSQNSSQSSENAQANLWQTRLAEAQMQYMEHAPELLMKRNNLNFLSVSKAGLGSPSPPETDESESDGEMSEIRESPSPKVKQLINPVRQLWTRSAPAQQKSISGLWNKRTETEKPWGPPYELPVFSVRRTTRRMYGPLAIESSHLWQSAPKLAPTKLQKGLWKKESLNRRPESMKAFARPVTMRPPRKSKRVTLLPDIIENPEPLPDKRGTLGIFQFPWGERSEYATVQYRPSQMLMAMPGTMSTGRPIMNPTLDSRAGQLETTEYSSSFFDEYDEEEGDNFSDFSGSDGDEFDETTLWEIASLLRTDKIPSKTSLLPISSQSSPSLNNSVLADYVADMPSDDEHGNDGLSDINIIVKEPKQIEGPKTSSRTVQPLLWTPRQFSQDRLRTFGLPQHESMGFNSYITESATRIRAKPRMNELCSVESSTLWSPNPPKTAISNDKLLWAAPKDTIKPQATPYSPIQPAQARHQASGLWVKSAGSVGSITQHKFASSRLPDPDSLVWHKLVSGTSDIIRSKPRIERTLLNINSINLWSAKSIPGSRGYAPTSNTIQNATAAPTRPVMLWKQISLPPETEEGGLFDIKSSRVSYRTTAEAPTALSLFKRPSRSNIAPLQQLRSTTLWSGKLLTLKPAPDGLWIPNIDNPQKPVSVYAAHNNSSGGLWRAPIRVSESDIVGLFDPKVTRYNFRRTSMLPVARLTSTKSRYTKEPVSVVTSNDLWAPQSLQFATADNRKDKSLWQGKVRPSFSTPTLFKLDLERKDYRTTCAEPAALVMVRRLRTVQQPMQRLQSTHRWVDNQMTYREVNWITMSTLRPVNSSVSAVSSTSPLLSTPMTDTASAKANATKASAVTTSSKNTGGFFSSWFGKKTNEDSVVAVLSEPAQQNAIIRNHDLPELPEGFVIKNLDSIPLRGPAKTALRHQYRLTTAYNSNWDAALNEAIAASYPGTVLAMRASYPKDWDNQLQEAITASHVAPRIIRNRQTPQDWSTALQQAIVESYARLQPSNFDVAVRHPVFFGSLATSAEIVHPAVTGYCTNARSHELSSVLKQPEPSGVYPASTSNSFLWTKPLKAPIVHNGGLWTSSSKTHMSIDVVSKRKGNDDDASRCFRKRAETFRPSVTEGEVDLWNQGLWKRGEGNNHMYHPSLREKNWLEDSVNKRFTRIELRY